MSRLDASSAPLTSITCTSHARFDRLPAYGLVEGDIAQALGPYFLYNGEPVCRRADDPGDLPTPQVGAPVLIGASHIDPRGTRWVVLGRTRTGRRIHLVIAAEGHRAVVITVWCPDDPVHLGCWQPHGLFPTRSGAMSLPPTHWYLTGPGSPVSATAGAR